MDCSGCLAGVRFRVMPEGLADLSLNLGGFAVWRSKFCFSASRNKIADVSRVRVHFDFFTGFAAEFEHTDPVVLEQHFEVIWGDLDRVLRTRPRSGQNHSRSETHNCQD